MAGQASTGVTLAVAAVEAVVEEAEVVVLQESRSILTMLPKGRRHRTR